MGLSRAPHERTFGLFSACPMISRSVRLSAGPMRDAPHVCAQSEVRARLPVQRGQPPGVQWPARASQEVRVTGKLVPLVRLREPCRTAETGSGDRHPAAEATSNSRRRRARPGRGRDERLLQRPTHDCAGKPRRRGSPHRRHALGERSTGETRGVAPNRDAMSSSRLSLKDASLPAPLPRRSWMRPACRLVMGVLGVVSVSSSR